MANRRMFSLSVVDTDKFLEMPATSRLLYYELGMRADDDGFVSPQKVIRMTGLGADDLKILVAKQFVIPFESGVIVITHWKENNFIRNDRYKPTRNLKELSSIKESNGEYALQIGMASSGIPDVIPESNQRYTQVRLGKDRLENNLDGKLPTDNYALFIDYFNELTGRNFRATDKKARRQFEYLRKQGYKREDFAKVVLNAYSDKYHKETNYKYLTPEFLTRTDKFDRYFNLPDKLQFKKTMSEEEKISSFHEKLAQAMGN